MRWIFGRGKILRDAAGSAIRYSGVDMTGSPDWVKLAEAFGATGLFCDRADELEATMAQALETDGPVLLDVRVSAEENCYPMIPPGNAARDMVEAPRGSQVGG